MFWPNLSNTHAGYLEESLCNRQKEFGQINQLPESYSPHDKRMVN